MNDEELAQLIRDVSAALDKHDNKADFDDIVMPLRAVTCPDAHVGRGADMDSSDSGYRLQLEWFAGQLLSMVDEKQWHSINSWINCTEKFTTRKED